MLTTKAQSPAAAEFLAAMASALKCSSARYRRTSFQLVAGTRPASTCAFISLSVSTYSWMLPSSAFLQASQEVSFTLPFFWTGTFPCTPASSTMVEAKTSSTPCGGLAMVLHSARSFLLSVSSAAMAFSTAGSALARSASVSRCFTATSPWILVTSSFSTRAFSVSASTTARSRATVSAMPSATARFRSASSSFPLSSSSMRVTSSPVSRSFCRPLASRAMTPSASARLRARSTP
jgi:hypothetical protein